MAGEFPVTLNRCVNVTFAAHQFNLRSNILSYISIGFSDGTGAPMNSISELWAKSNVVDLGPPLGRLVPYRCQPSVTMAFIIIVPSALPVILSDVLHFMGLCAIAQATVTVIAVKNDMIRCI